MLFEDQDNSIRFAAQILRPLIRSGRPHRETATLMILLEKQPIPALQGGWTE